MQLLTDLFFTFMFQQKKYPPAKRIMDFKLGEFSEHLLEVYGRHIDSTDPVAHHITPRYTGI